jgi:hypothetical protein
MEVHGGGRGLLARGLWCLQAREVAALGAAGRQVSSVCLPRARLVMLAVELPWQGQVASAASAACISQPAPLW